MPLPTTTIKQTPRSTEESLLLRGIKHMESAEKIVARVRAAAQCSENEVLCLAVEKTRSRSIILFLDYGYKDVYNV
jgi:hypothetical protein